jgi:acetylornithine aminotransferase
MKPFDVYPIYPVEPVKAKGCTIWDNSGNEYLDFYGGHAVISIGHSHPEFLLALGDQMKKLVFYSNSVMNGLQNKLANNLGEISGYNDYKLFMCNSGAEANENALKLASFHTGKKKIIAFKKAFHGRTSGAVACTDNPSIIALFNTGHDVSFISLGDINAVDNLLQKSDVAAVIIEGIQGVGGVHLPEIEFMQHLSKLCTQYGTVLILDEIQSGYGRTGKFFAHQFFGIKPDLITIAKGMGNGFPVGAVLIGTVFKEQCGLLGSTFGGNHLACAASIAVLEVIRKEGLIENAERTGNYLRYLLQEISEIKEIRGLGLMLALEFDTSVIPIREKLLFQGKIFTGISGTNIIRLLPPLCVSDKEIDFFVHTLKTVLKS